MMAISTQGIGRVDVQAKKSPKNVKDDEKTADVFASLMNMTSMQNQTSDIKQAVDNVAVQKKTDYANRSTAEKYDNTVYDSRVAGKKMSSEASTVEQDVSCDIKDVIQQIKDVLEEKLSVTEEELNKLLETFGVDVTDLLDLGNIKEFILNVQGASDVELLINEELSGIIQDVSEFAGKLLEDAGITDEEQLNILIDGYKQEMQLVDTDMAEETEVKVSDADIIPEEMNKTEVIKSEENVDITVDEAIWKEDAFDTKRAFDSDGEMMKQGQTDDMGSHVMANLSQSIDNVIMEVDMTGVQTYADASMEADILRQIIDSVRVNLTKDSTSLTLQLNPENLGKVQISVSSRNGMMQAQIVAETEAARHAIESNIAVLKENFNNHELKVDAIEVMVASYEFFEQNQENKYDNEQNGRRGGQAGAMDVQDDWKDDDSAEQDEHELTMMKVQGSSVSYSV